MDNTTSIAAFKAIIERLRSEGRTEEFLAKAFTGEEDRMAENNTSIGTAMLNFCVTDEVHRKMRDDGEPCTKESIAMNETKVNSKKNLTSESTITDLFPPDLIPRDSGLKPILATVRAAFYVAYQEEPETARGAIRAIVNRTMPQGTDTIENLESWAKVLLPIPVHNDPFPTTISLEQASIPEEQQYVTLRNRSRSDYIHDHKDKNILRTFILLSRLLPSTVLESIMLVDKSSHTAVAMLKIRSENKTERVSFSSPPMTSSTQAKNKVAHDAVNYVINNYSSTMSVDDDNEDDQDYDDKDNLPGDEYLPERKIQKIEEKTTEN